MTYPSYLTPGGLAKPTPDYSQLRLVSVVGGTHKHQVRTMKLAAARRATLTVPLSTMRVYTENPDLWAFSGLTDVKSLSSLTSDIGQFPDVVFVDQLDPFVDTEGDLIEHVKASVRRDGFLMVSYTSPHPVVHNADLVWVLDETASEAAG